MNKLTNSEDDDQCTWDQNNKKETLENIYRLYSAEIHNYALKLTNNADAASDILQQVFLQLVAKERIFPPVRPLLYRIATDAATDWYRDCTKRRAMSIRSEKRGNSSDEGFEPADVKATQPETTVCRQEDAHRIMDAFRQLSFQEQAAVKAVYFDDLDTKEAAERLGMRHGTLRSHISRAIAKLQTKMNLIE